MWYIIPLIICLLGGMFIPNIVDDILRNNRKKNLLTKKSFNVLLEKAAFANTQ